jgi:penicillin-binding protein 2D
LYSSICCRSGKFSLLAVLVLLVVGLVTPAHGREGAAAYRKLVPGYTSIKVFDRTGRFVGRISAKERYWAPIERIPVFLRKAVVAVEDARFYEHSGIDMRGIARALVKDVVKRRMAEGGSTITQQLIKNRYLSNEKTIDRKVKEARMAMEFEKTYSKQQILEMYFNEIYYGNGAWGIVQAARLYFDKDPEQLTDAECALLAGVQKSPARYNPLGKPADVTQRRDVVLQRMVAMQMISPRQRLALRNQRVTFVQPNQAPQYLTLIRNKIIERYGADSIEQGGLEVVAALDLALQKHAEHVVREGVRHLSSELQGALISLDPATGDIVAAVGGVDAGADSYNRAVIAKRQPGSSIKPLIYAAALEQGITASSTWDDGPVSYDRGNGRVWRPQNYGGEHRGVLSLRQALAYSNNIITVKLLETIGVSNFTAFAETLGLPLRAHNDLSLALGTEDVSLLDLVASYAPFANGGSRVKPRTIVRIYERKHHSWYENQSLVTPVISPAAAYITTQMLKDVMIYGTAKSLDTFAKSRPSAGKTGTTDDYRDAWFVGYTPQLLTGVWVGHDKPRPGGKGFTGGAVSAPLWARFMATALTARPVVDFPKPDTVVTVTIDPVTGFLATDACPVKRQEYFALGTEPVAWCPEHGAAPTIETDNPVPPAGNEKPDGSVGQEEPFHSE